MEDNVCAYCGKSLVTVDEIHVVEGVHYCSKDCAIIHIANGIIMNAKAHIMNAKAQAIEQYNNMIEIVTPTDIGICYEKIWTSYSRDTDVTTIFLSKCLDEECMEVKSVELIGFYFGEPNEDDTLSFTGEFSIEY